MNGRNIKATIAVLFANVLTAIEGKLIYLTLR